MSTIIIIRARIDSDKFIHENYNLLRRGPVSFLFFSQPYQSTKIDIATSSLNAFIFLNEQVRQRRRRQAQKN